MKHAEQVLQRHGVAATSASKPASSAAQKVRWAGRGGRGQRSAPHPAPFLTAQRVSGRRVQVADLHAAALRRPLFPPSLLQLYVQQDPQDLVLGGDVPISSIQATIAKLSIRPLPGGTEPAPNGQLPEPPPSAAPLPAPASVAPLVFPGLGGVAGAEATPPFPPPAVPAPGPPEVVGLPPVDHGSPMDRESGEDKAGGLPEGGPSASAPAPQATAPPCSSSLELLASLTPEAFTLDSTLKGRHKVSKQSFLQPQNGEGLRGAPPSDDPLSRLDPLWTLNKA